ncbi:MAG: hypothetical protein R3E48_02010 [Burkholderiaceae bacterium]
MPHVDCVIVKQLAPVAHDGENGTTASANGLSDELRKLGDEVETAMRSGNECHDYGGVSLLHYLSISLVDDAAEPGGSGTDPTRFVVLELSGDRSHKGPIDCGESRYALVQALLDDRHWRAIVERAFEHCEGYPENAPGDLADWLIRDCRKTLFYAANTDRTLVRIRAERDLLACARRSAASQVEAAPTRTALWQSIRDQTGPARAAACSCRQVDARPDR